MSGQAKGVGVRLYVAGGTEVRREFADITAAGKRTFSGLAAGQGVVNPALRAISAGVGEVKQGITGLAAEAGSAGTVLSALGPAGVALAVGLAGASAAMGAAADAAQRMDDLAATADHLGVTTKALQELRFAAETVDVPAATLDAQLKALNSTLGALQTGVGDGKIRKAFEELGISQSAIAGLHDASELLPLLADRISKVGDHAAQVQIAKKLQIEDLLPMLQLGSDGLATMMNRAEELGTVLDDTTIQSAAALNEEMRIADERFKTAGTALSVHFIPALTELKTAAADAIQEFTKFLRHVEDFEIRMKTVKANSKGLFTSPADIADAWNAGTFNWDKMASPDRSFTVGTPAHLVPKGDGESTGRSKGSRARKSGDTRTKLTYAEAATQTAIDPTTGRRLVPITDEEAATRAMFPRDDAAKIKIETSVDLKSAVAEASKGFDELRQQTTDAFKSGLEFALHGGNIFDLFKQRLEEAAIDGLSKALTNSLGGQSGGGGLGGFIASAVTFLFGGGRHANNSTINGGEVSSYAEYGSELALFNKPGQIFNHADTVKLLQGVAGTGDQSSGGVSVMFAPVINAQGAGPREVDALKAELAKMKREIPGTIIATVNDGMNRRSIRRV